MCAYIYIFMYTGTLVIHDKNARSFVSNPYFCDLQSKNFVDTLKWNDHSIV